MKNLLHDKPAPPPPNVTDTWRCVETTDDQSRAGETAPATKCMLFVPLKDGRDRFWP